MHRMCFCQGQMTFFHLTNTSRGNGFYYLQFNQFVDPTPSSDRGLTAARLTGGLPATIQFPRTVTAAFLALQCRAQPFGQATFTDLFHGASRKSSSFSDFPVDQP